MKTKEHEAGLALDAARYRWLRTQHWNEAPLCVVSSPRQSVKLGYECPSMERLDDVIDAARLKCARAPSPRPAS